MSEFYFVNVRLDEHTVSNAVILQSDLELFFRGELPAEDDRAFCEHRLLNPLCSLNTAVRGKKIKIKMDILQLASVLYLNNTCTQTERVSKPVM